MKTTNGLDVPAPGQGTYRGLYLTGGRPLSGSRSTGRQDHPRSWVDAEAARPGQHLVGPRSKARYEVLAVDDAGPGLVTLTVRSPAGQVRTWTRGRRFGLEQA